MTDTITVWVTEHDDDEVRFVVNTEFEMEQTFNDHINQVAETMTIPLAGNEYDFEPADTLAAMDPEAWISEFTLFKQGWRQMEIPTNIHNTADERDWVEAHL